MRFYIGLTVISLAFFIGCNNNSGELVTKSEETEKPEVITDKTEMPIGHPPVASNQGMPPADSIVPEPEMDDVTMEGNTLVVGPVQFEVSDAWQKQTPSSSFRAAQFSIPAAEGDAEPAELAVFQGIGGSNQQNVDRWIGQFQNATQDDYQVDQKQQGPFEIMLLDITGTYGASMGPMMGGGEMKEGQRMLAASVEGPGGPWHFKLVGPEATVSQTEDQFNEMINSLSTVQ